MISYFQSLEDDDELIGQLESLLNSRWTQVKKIEEIRSDAEYVYDVSVADWETFLAGFGGLLVHNTFTVAQVIEKNAASDACFSAQ